MDGVARSRHDSVVTTSGTEYFDVALNEAEMVKGFTSPNPWVGAAVVTRSGDVFSAATAFETGPHAETRALNAAGKSAAGATLYVTLEPCAHFGNNPPCVDAIISAGITRVIVGIEDPDDRVRGRGIEQLRNAGVEVEILDDMRVHEQLASYLHHRRTGRPLVVLKMAMTVDGRIAAPDGSSQWITGAPAREDVHLLRARSDSIVVGAGTARIDDPSLTVRLDGIPEHRLSSMRIVVGQIPKGAKVEPALSWTDSLPALLDHLGSQGHLQLLVEGGAGLAASFHREGLIDRYVIYVAPAFLGGEDGIPLLRGPGLDSLADAWRGRFVDVRQLGDDVRLTIEPQPENV